MDDRDTERLELAGAAALAAAYPIAGLLGVILTRLSQNRQRRQAETLRVLGDGLERVNDRLDQDYVASDEFEGLVEEVIEKANQRKEIDKREYYAALLASAALPGRPDESSLDRMIDTLGRLRPSHLWLLGALMGDYTWATESHGLPSGFDQEFRTQHPTVDMERVKLDWRDLEAAGLVQSYPSGMTSQEGARNFRGRLTDFGRSFHQFVVLPYSDVHPPK